MNRYPNSFQDKNGKCVTGTLYRKNYYVIRYKFYRIKIDLGENPKPAKPQNFSARFLTFSKLFKMF